MIKEHSLTYSLFPSDNAFEIPSLRLDMQPDKVDIPFVAFGESSRKIDLGGYGSIHFYVDDYRFNSVYDKPSTIVAANPHNILMSRTSRVTLKHPSQLVCNKSTRNAQSPDIAKTTASAYS